MDKRLFRNGVGFSQTSPQMPLPRATMTECGFQPGFVIVIAQPHTRCSTAVLAEADIWHHSVCVGNKAENTAVWRVIAWRCSCNRLTHLCLRAELIWTMTAASNGWPLFTGMVETTASLDPSHHCILHCIALRPQLSGNNYILGCICKTHCVVGCNKIQRCVDLSWDNWHTGYR